MCLAHSILSKNAEFMNELITSNDQSWHLRAQFVTCIIISATHLIAGILLLPFKKQQNKWHKHKEL